MCRGCRVFIPNQGVWLSPDIRTEVVIDTQKIQRLPYGIQVIRLNVRFQLRKDFGRIGAGQQRSQKGAVPKVIVALSHNGRGLGAVDRNTSMHVQSGAKLPGGVAGAKRLESRSLGQIQMMSGGVKRFQVSEPRRVRSDGVSK